MPKKYQPIDCNLYDEYLLFVLKKSLVKIYFHNEEEQPLKSIIRDVFTRSKAEYMLLENGNEIRLDQIKKVVDVSKA